MKKVFLVLAIITAAATTVNAQKSSDKLAISFGVDLGSTTGDVNKVSPFVVGADIQGEYGLSDKFGVMASVGFDAWLSKGTGESIKFIPVLVGARYFFNSKIYAAYKAGYSIGISKTILKTTIDGAFTNVFGAGYKPSPRSDVYLYYKMLSKAGADVFGKGVTFSSIGLRFAYTLNGN